MRGDRGCVGVNRTSQGIGIGVDTAGHGGVTIWHGDGVYGAAGVGFGVEFGVGVGIDVGSGVGVCVSVGIGFGVYVYVGREGRLEVKKSQVQALCAWCYTKYCSNSYVQ